MVQHDEHKHITFSSQTRISKGLIEMLLDITMQNSLFHQKYDNTLSKFHYSLSLKYLSRSSFTSTKHSSSWSNFFSMQIFIIAITPNTASD